MENLSCEHEEQQEYTLLPEKFEDENQEEYIGRISQAYRELPKWEREYMPFKSEVRMFLHKEEKMLDSEIGVLLNECATTIHKWRFKNNLQSNYNPEDVKAKIYNRARYKMTLEEKERALEFIAKVIAISDGKLRL